MYTANKTATFHPASKCRHGPSRVLFTLYLLLAINVALKNACLAGTTYYVDKNHASANDENPGTEEALPWNTLTKAANTAQAGDIVLVKAGIYNELLRPANSGSPGEMITFKAYPGHECQGGPGERKTNCRVIINGTGLNNHGVYLGQTSYIRIEGFEVKNSGLCGIMGYPDFYTASSGGNWEIVNNYVHHNGGGHFAGEGNVGDPPTDGAGFVTCNTNKVLIENNEFYANADAGIRFWGNNHGNSNVIIRGNNIHYNSSDGIEVGNANSQTLVENFIVEDNVLYDSFDSEQHQDAINFYGGSNITIRNNIAYDFTQLIYFPVKDITDGTGLLEDVDIYGNILYTDKYWTEWGGQWCKGIFIDASQSDNIVRNINIHSNTLGWIGFGNWGVYILGIDGTEINGITLRNNIFCESGVDIGDIAKNVSSNYNLYYNIDSDKIPSYEGNYSLVDTDPQFVNYERHVIHDFRLKSTSPAIDKGDELSSLFTLPTPFLDIDENNRPQDGDGNGSAEYDIGAYECVSGPPDTTAPHVPQNLSATPASESQIDLSWDASNDPESGISHYKIYRDGNPIGQSSSTSYSDTRLNSNTRYCYEVSAVNGAGLESPRSSMVCESTLADTTPPSILSVSVQSSVHILFNEPLDEASATDPLFYHIESNNVNEPNIIIYSATLDTDQRTVILETSDHTEGVDYTLTVIGVKDLAGNAVNMATYTYQYNGDLIGHWKFDDGSGSSAADSSGRGNTGTLVNGPTWNTGKINGALSFDGVDDSVQIGTSDIDVSGGTIAFWAYPEGFSSTGQYLFGHAAQPWSNRIQLYTDDASGNLDLGLGDSHTRHTNIQDLNTNIWYHIALTWDGTNYVVYVDGGGKASGTYTGLSTLETYADIGNNGYSSDRSEAFNGIIDEVRIYNRALSAAEIVELYGQAPPADTNAPVISNIDYSNISSSGATITWLTDKSSTSQIEYGLDTTYGNVTNLDTSLVTSHSVALAGLSPSTMYHLRVKSADASGNESISPDNTFTTDPVTTYIITASASGSGTISPSGTSQVVSGGSQTYTITKDPGYHIADVLVDGGSVGAVSSYTFTNVAANHTITAIFTYTITASAGTGGQINPSGTTQVVPGGSQEYNITADPGYKIYDVIVDGSSVGAVTSYSFTNVTADRTIHASFAIDEVDVTAPTVTNLSPQADSIQAHLNTLITLDITDSGDGVDANSVTIKVNNNTVYSGNTAKYSSAYGECYRTGTKANYTFTYQSNERFDFDQIITVTVNVTDLAGNTMDEYSYSFQTKMRAFGKNKKVNKDKNLNTESTEFTSITNNDKPATCSDSEGNIWAAWHAGVTGSRDIYIGKLTKGEEDFGDSKNLTNNSTDQCNPAMAVGSDDKLYVTWQDNRRGNWDIYVSTSSDGINFSTERRVTDSNDNQINPTIVVDRSNNAYIVWEDDRNGNQDIYIGSSNNGFATKTISQITSDPAYQGEPAIAADSDNTVYVVWTDTRSSKNDIYGAASNNGPWTNIPIVTTEHSQSSPAIATETTGSILHLVWVDDRSGDDDVFYDKTTGGLSSLTGNSIIDDTTGADQLRPAIAVTGSTGNNLLVFVCWEDERNTDYDIYFAELGSGSGTNVFVDDDGTNTGQSDPAIGIDGDGHPYLVWTDNRNTNKDIYYAGSTVIEPTALASGNISTSSTTTVQTADGVSVVVPPGAYPCNIEITISEVKNPPATDKEYLSLPYDFGPSGIEFDPPVTITIPYEVFDSGYSASAYWYNPLTAAPSQQGITDIETIFISSKPYLRFKTTHFTQFFIGGSFGSTNIDVSGGGGGGGCSMSANSQASILDLLLPYIGLTVAMVVLKLKDRRKKKTRNIT